MTEAEVRVIMHARGWFYQERIRHKSRIKYVYAKRRQGTRMIERYIGTLLTGVRESEKGRKEEKAHE